MPNENRKTTDTHNRNYAYHVKSANKRQAVVDINDPVVNISFNPPCRNVRIEDTEFYQLIIPFIIWMKIFGGFFSPDADKVGDDSSRTSSSIRQQRSNKLASFLEGGWRLFSRYGRQWSLFLGVSLLLTTLLNLGVLVYFIPLLTLEVIFFGLYIISCMVLACVGSVVYYQFNNNGKMLRLFQKYSSLEISLRDRNILDGKIKMAGKLITMSCFAGNVTIILGLAYILSTSHGKNSLTIPLDMALEWFPPPMNRILYYVYFLAAVGFTNMLCMQPSFIALLSVIISVILMQFNGALKSDPHNNNGNTFTENRIESMHSKFQRIVEMIKDLDDGIGLYTIPSLVILISNLILITYFLLFLCASDSTKGIFFSWFLMLISAGMCVLLPAVMINEMAMKSYKKLHKIDISNLSSTAVLKFFVLMNSANRPIGITAMGFFTITKSFIISLVATFFSYFFLLIEFSPSSSMCEDTNSTAEFH